MKKHLFLRFTRASLFCSLAVVLFFAACSTDNASRSTEATSPPKWEEQLQYGLYLAKQRGDDQLRLLSYEYLGKVKTEEEMIELTDEMFADETYTVISHFLPDGQVEYEFLTWAEFRKHIDYKYAGLKIRDDIRKEDIVINQTDVIELTWSYKGNIYRSKAIASHDHGLIYDNISTYASTPNSCVDDAEEMTSEAISTRSGQPYTGHFKKTPYKTNDIGVLQWSAYIECDSPFNEYGILQQPVMSASPHPQRGWVCDAKIRTVFGTPFYSNIHKFAWGYAYNDDRGSAYLTEFGDGYYINYGAKGETGTEIHQHPNPIQET